MTVALPLLVGALTFAAAAVALDRRSTAVAGRRVAAHVAPKRTTRPREGEEVLATRLERRLARTERRLEKLPLWDRFARLVERADLPAGPAELFLGVAGSVLLLPLAGAAAGLPAAAVAILVLLLLGALRIALGLRVDRRRRAFEQQLPELLAALASALRAGHGLTQALQAVAADAAEPAAKELGRVLAEARLGRPLEDALLDLGSRVDSHDLDFVLDAIVVQRQVGGSLAGIFDLVADSVRQRQQLALRLRALTATGRTSASVLVALPIVLALVLSALDRSYLAPLLHTPIGHVLLGTSAVLMAAGSLWLRRIVSYRG